MYLVANAAPTSTILQNLVITGVKNAPCLLTDANGLVGSTTCGSGGSSTISINGVSSTVFSLNSSTYLGITASGTAFTFTNLGVTSTAGNWAGTWQGVNSTTFYLASNPSAYLAGVTASTPLSGSGTVGSPLIFTNPGYLSSSTGLTYFFPATSTVFYNSTNPAGYLSSSTGLTYFFPATSTTFLSTTTGNWAGTWQGTNSSTYQPALGFTPYNATNPAFYLSSTTGASYFAPSSTVSSQWTTTSTGIFYNGGNVGIGTTGPNTALDVNGDITDRNLISSPFLATNATGKLVAGTILGTANGGTATTTALGSNAFSSVAYYPNSNPSNFISGNQTITLSGDISGSGATTIATTLPTVNSNVGSFTNANITVNGKGLITAASNGTGSSGAVTSVSVTTANGVSATVATPTTTPALTFTLGAINPTSVNGLALSRGANSVSTNVAVGVNALASGSLSGGYNTANGDASLQNNTSGNYNTANGYYSLYANTTGGYNTANGLQSLYSNTSGNYNTANGYYSLGNNTTGTQNTANGYASLYNNTTGGNNTANGYASLDNNTTSSNSVALGDYAGYNSTIPNAFYVGDIHQSSAANDQNYSLLYGNFSGVVATTTGQFLDVNGHLGSATSTVSVTSCGTGSPTVTGSDNGGVITAGTVATTCTLNFASKWNYNPSCVVTSRTASVAVGYSVTTSTLTVTNAALGADVIDYHCYGNPN
jgi:hypothetical protein